jgi:hypothetical protein
MAPGRWLSAEEYAGLVSLCQLLPGPTSSQVGFLIGLRRAGYLGALAASAMTIRITGREASAGFVTMGDIMRLAEPRMEVTLVTC